MVLLIDLDTLVFETKKHFILAKPTGYEVYEVGTTHARLISFFGGKSMENHWLERAKQFIELREASK